MNRSKEPGRWAPRTVSASSLATTSMPIKFLSLPNIVISPLTGSLKLEQGMELLAADTKCTNQMAGVVISTKSSHKLPSNPAKNIKIIKEALINYEQTNGAEGTPYTLAYQIPETTRTQNFHRSSTIPKGECSVSRTLPSAIGTALRFKCTSAERASWLDLQRWISTLLGTWADHNPWLTLPMPLSHYLSDF